MILYLISLIIILKFIREQFEFKEVSRFRLFILPIIFTIQLVSQFKLLPSDYDLFVLVLIIAILIGLYQAIFTEIKVKKIHIDNKELEITYFRGGIHYLIGWILIFISQIVIYYLSSIENFHFNELYHELITEISRDLFIWVRFSNQPEYWYVIALYAFSTLSYSIFLSCKNANIRKKIFKF